MKRLEIGPGKHPAGRKGWDRLGPKPGRWVTHIGTWGDGPLPFADNTYGLVYASHVLEHVPWFRAVDALREAWRVLVRGGVIEVWVPDFGAIVQAIDDEQPGDDWRKHNPTGNPMLWANGRLFSYGPEGNWHRSAYTQNHLTYCLKKAGFQRPLRLDRSETRGKANHGPAVLGMRATKP